MKLSIFKLIAILSHFYCNSDWTHHGVGNLTLISNNFKTFIVGLFQEDDSHKQLTICPRHREAYGLRWRCNKRICAVPDEMAAHKSKTTKGDRGIDFAQSAIIFHCSRTLVPIGSRKYITVSSQLTCVYCVTFASTHLLGHGESTKTYLTLFLSAGEKGQPEIRLRSQATMLSTGYFFLPLPPTTRAPRPSLRLRARSKFLVPPAISD